ncbi:putative toxin [Dysgonomonas sp. UBA7698]|uniref:putative toxin n=1 Tax=Dysgonomonas sp. UBA7698 TaxID=1946427 RepID=UPI0025C4EC67|nr:putative toxin [Dysgonomonas sp. UBA7698]
MQNARQAGIDGEKAVDITGPKERIPSHPGTASYRIPDRVTATTIEEVKNVKSLTFTKQLEDMLIEPQNKGK